jgi:hypothetical protein
LGLGVLSSVPSQAAITGTIAVTTTNGTATTTTADSTTAGSLKVRWLATATADSVVITTSLNSQPSGGGTPTLRFFAKDTLTSIATTTLYPDLGGASSLNDTASVIGGGAGYVSATFLYQLSTTSGIKAGTYTFTTTITPWSTTAETSKVVTQDVSIVVTAPASASTTAASNASTSKLLTATGTASADSVTAESTSVSLLATASSTARASVFVQLLNAAGTADQMTLDSLTVTIDKGNLATNAGGIKFVK